MVKIVLEYLDIIFIFCLFFLLIVCYFSIVCNSSLFLCIYTSSPLTLSG